MACGKMQLRETSGYRADDFLSAGPQRWKAAAPTKKPSAAIAKTLVEQKASLPQEAFSGEDVRRCARRPKNYLAGAG
jgi:hypothetical protein